MTITITITIYSHFRKIMNIPVKIDSLKPIYLQKSVLETTRTN